MPFARLTCPEGTTPDAQVVKETYTDGTSYSVSLQCTGEGGSDSERLWGVRGAWVLYLVTVGVGAITGGWLLLSLWLRPRPAPPTSPPPGINLEGDMGLRQLISSNQKIAAVKHVRQASGAGLKEAKQYVDWLTAQMGPGEGVPAGKLPVQMAVNDQEVLDWLTQGNKIQAIKRLFDLTGLNLQEAKNVIEAIERGEITIREGAPLIHNLIPGSRNPTEAFYDPQVQAELAQGRKINAIKRVREITGLGLKEAKDLVDSWETR